ncbi:MAG: hypothetical protein HKN87_12535 [Saprospiraceae bacterium]|nr:hypothetical protein [Saprospiraceae bacterium]
MALIGKIRKNSWLLIVVIGLALAAFVIMDMTGQGGPGGQELTLVEVDGDKVGWNEFQQAERILYTGSEVDVFSRRNYLYNYFVDQAIVQDEAEANGLYVPKEELMDLQFGNNLSTLIQQRFSNPQTGQVDRTQLNNIRQSINQGDLSPQLRELWAYQEKEIITERLTDKLTNLVEQGLYTPTWMVESTNIDQTVRTDFLYVRVPYEEVPENDVTVTDADLRAYLKENSAEYEREAETRIVDYLVYNVEPTGADTAMHLANINNLIEEFKITENDTLFVETNLGSFDLAYAKKSEISTLIADSVFQVEEGSVIGPYIENGAYRAVKVLDRMVIPDSVHTRHILRRAQTLEQYQAAQKTADSLVQLIESGAFIFDSLAADFNQGSMSVTLNGGDLGNIARNGFVKPFNDLVFYNAEIGKVYTVVTEFGVHIVEVLDRTYETNEEGAQVAYIEVPIIPSDDTQSEIYDLVLDVVSKNRTLADLRSAIADDPSLRLQSSAPLEENDFTIGSLGAEQSSRDVVRWAFEPSVEAGDVSPEVYVYQEPTLYYNNKYVVAGINKIMDAGEADLEDVRATIEGLVKNQKKAALLKEELKDQNDLNRVAEIYSASIDTAKGVNFLTDFIANLGEEPNVAANAQKVPLNEASDPIEGVRGVYLIMPINRTEPNEPNIPSLRASYTNQIANQTKAGLIQSLRENADIEDSRYQYY